MMFSAKQRKYEHPFNLLGAALLGALQLMQTGCSLIYAEISTPIHSPAEGEVLQPEPPSDIIYVSIKSARIPVKTRDGRSWDKMGGSAPDVYAILFLDQLEVERTPVVSDSFSPKWENAQANNYKISPSTEVRVELWDENALVAHPICNQVITDIGDSSDVGELEVSCDSGATVVLEVAPARAKVGVGLFVEVRSKAAVVTRVIAASSAGRAGVAPGDQIITARGRNVSSMTQGELESVLKAKAQAGLPLEIRGKDGELRKVELREEAMYPVMGEGVAVR